MESSDITRFNVRSGVQLQLLPFPSSVPSRSFPSSFFFCGAVSLCASAALAPVCGLSRCSGAQQILDRQRPLSRQQQFPQLIQLTSLSTTQIQQRAPASLLSSPLLPFPSPAFLHCSALPLLPLWSVPTHAQAHADQQQSRHTQWFFSPARSH